MMLDRIALVLVIVGSLNWGAIGLFGFDLVAWICGGAGTLAARIIYTVVALAGYGASPCFSVREKMCPCENANKTMS